MRFSPIRDEILNLVSEYLNKNNIVVPAFKDNRPGYDWFNSFMERNKLSLKKANMICSARKPATANPFIVYDFYDILREIIEKYKFKDTQIWNCDESGFPTDPHRCKVVSVKGQTAYKTTSGARRENITTLAAVNSADRALDPVVIYQGKHMQSTWKPKQALPDSFYGRSDNGCMTSEIFFQWFQKFCIKVEERPLLLILDGHLTHVSIAVLEEARDQNVHIIKLPPHVRDVLQPLDVACFSGHSRENGRKC